MALNGTGEIFDQKPNRPLRYPAAVTNSLIHATRRLEAVNRYENHILNTAEQAVEMVERVGASNVFVHLDTYHMNIEEKGIANGILRAREHLKYIHLSASDRGTPGADTVAWDEVFAALAAIGFKGGMAMESFITVPQKSPPLSRYGARLPLHGRKFLARDCRSFGIRRNSMA